MKYQCPYCNEPLAEDTIISGTCPNCKRVVDFSSVKTTKETPRPVEEKEPIEGRQEKSLPTTTIPLDELKRGLKFAGITIAVIFVLALILSLIPERKPKPQTFTQESSQ